MLHRGPTVGNAGTRSAPDRPVTSLTVPMPVMVLVLSTVMLLLAACGGDADPGRNPGDDNPGGTGDGPRVADARFEGDFLIEEVSDRSGPVSLATTPSINFETVFGGLTVKPGCNTYFGSFTLAEDGTASITVAGGSSEDCGALAGQEQAILETLEAVTTWTEVEGGFRFAGPGDHSIVLQR